MSCCIYYVLIRFLSISSSISPHCWHYRYTQSFTVLSSNVGCLADCYLGGDGCTELENWLTYSGTICKEQFCSLKWGEIDEAYHALRVCAAQAIAQPTDGDKDEYVSATHSNQVTSNLCAFNYCT